MNIFVTTTAAILTLTAGGFHAVPLAQVSAFNPFNGIAICASGVELELNAEGVHSTAADTSGLSLTLTLKSGTPIRVSF